MQSLMWLAACTFYNRQFHILAICLVRGLPWEPRFALACLFVKLMRTSSKHTYKRTGWQQIVTMQMASAQCTVSTCCSRHTKMLVCHSQIGTFWPLLITCFEAVTCGCLTQIELPQCVPCHYDSSRVSSKHLLRCAHWWYARGLAHWLNLT